MIMHELPGPQLATNFVRPPMTAVVASGESVARAANLEAAATLIVAEARRVLGARASVVQRTDGGWATLAAADAGADLRALEIDAALESLAPGAVALMPGETDAAMWTAASMRIAGSLPLAVIVEGDWTPSDAGLTTWAVVVAFAIDAVRRNDERRRAERRLLVAYAAARRIGRLGRVRHVCQRVVEHVALLLDAERVSLAVYRPADHSLSIEAATGYPMASVEDVRIQPGAWVMGHVFSSGRPLYVRDVRELQGPVHASERYRTQSFAAVPLFASAEVVGVLAVTDKNDGSPVAASDMLTVRFAAAIAVLAIVAARSRDEAGRLSYAATVDALTGLHNRPYLDERLHEEVERARRNGASLAVRMADVDDF
jgi:GAF domain-containing protein